MNFEELIEWMKEKHGEQRRKQGTPYYLHPLAVSNLLKEQGLPEEYQVAALFHDLLEDTETTYAEIVAISNKRIAEAVRLVTKEKGYDMKEYMDRIQKNDMARMVKIGDRIHNLSEMHYGPKLWQKKYLYETEKWFPNLVKGTVLEEMFNQTLKKAKKE